jgi:polar amino acid transport system permease protein
VSQNFNFPAVLSGEFGGWLLHGVATTLQLFGAAWVAGFAVALVLVLMRTSPIKPLQAFVALYVEYHRNVPLMVQILCWYFAIPEFLPTPVKTWLYGQNIEFVSAAIALALGSAAYISEDLRSGIRSISHSQFEASRALGLSFFQTMRLVVVPQALRAAVPPLISQALLLFKNTSLAMAIGLAELTYRSREIESNTFLTFEIYAICTAIYLALSFCIMGLGELAEHKYKTRGA